MKTILVMTLLSVFASVSQAESNLFAACSGDHHGTYLDFFSDVNNQNVYFETSNDGEDDPVKFNITKMHTYGQKVEVKDYKHAISEAIKTSNGDGEYEGMLYIEAESGQSKILMNINKFTGENFLVFNGYVEALNCPTELVKN